MDSFKVILLLCTFTPALAQQRLQPSEAIVITSLRGPESKAGPAQLSAGVPASFTLPRGNGLSLASGDLGFQIAVPEGATTLELQLTTTTPGADIDLYVRRGRDVEIIGGIPVADYRSEGLTGAERVRITTNSNPPLQPGTYYVAFGVFTSAATAGTVTAAIGREPNPLVTPEGLQPGRRIGMSTVPPSPHFFRPSSSQARAPT